MKRKNRIRVALLMLVLASGFYFLWPLYGFVSHQFSIAPTPWGWRDLPPPAQPRDFTGTIDAESGRRALAILERRRAAVWATSLAAAVYVDGKLAWAGASGWADIERREPARPDTAYRIGSTSKVVTATLFARLVERGTVDPDAPVSRYLADQPNAAWRDITLRQLASHTAGIVGYEENSGWIGLYQSMALQSHFASPGSALSVFDGSPLLFRPGTGYHYSSYDYVLLGAALEAAAAKPFLDLVSAEVTAPLGIDRLGADELVAHNGRVATFYNRRGEQLRPWRNVDLSHKLAGGGFVASPVELARIGSAWLDKEYISSATRATFWSPVTLKDGKENPESYALGLVCLGKTGPILERADCGERIGESYGTSTFYAGTDHREAA